MDLLMFYLSNNRRSIEDCDNNNNYSLTYGCRKTAALLFFHCGEMKKECGSAETGGFAGGGRDNRRAESYILFYRYTQTHIYTHPRTHESNSAACWVFLHRCVVCIHIHSCVLACECVDD